jgi:hypothetical protein
VTIADKFPTKKTRHGTVTSVCGSEFTVTFQDGEEQEFCSDYDLLPGDEGKVQTGAHVHWHVSPDASDCGAFDNLSELHFEESHE